VGRPPDHHQRQRAGDHWSGGWSLRRNPNPVDGASQPRRIGRRPPTASRPRRRGPTHLDMSGHPVPQPPMA